MCTYVFQAPVMHDSRYLHVQHFKRKKHLPYGIQGKGCLLVLRNVAEGEDIWGGT